jgi:hypothetical protein
VLPYGIGDAAIGFATAPLPELLVALGDETAGVSCAPTLYANIVDTASSRVFT